MAETEFQIVPGEGRGASFKMGAAEAAIWPLHKPHAKSKAAILLQAKPVGGLPFAVNAAPPLDAAADFFLLDRVGRRKLVASTAAIAQPILVYDDVADRWRFRAAGNGQGAMRCVAVPDKAGAETNDKPVWVPGVGYSITARVIVPIPSSTTYGATWGAATGGCLIGGGSATQANNLWIGFANGGQFQVHNRFGSVMWQSPGTYNDGVERVFQVIYNPMTQVISVYVDGVLVNSVTGGSIAATVDVVAPTTNSDKVSIGACGGAAPFNTFNGLWSWIDILPGVVNATQRATLRTAALAA